MTVLDILKTSSLYLNKTEDLDLFFNESNLTPTSTQLKEFDLLLKALNLITLEIASEFMPVEKIEEVEFTNNETSLSNLTKTVSKILSVKKDGKSRTFKVCDGKIFCNFDGKAKVNYSYLPNSLTKDDDIDFFDGIISEKTLALGVVMEYMYLQNLMDEVSIWEDRFYGSLKNNLRKLGFTFMPKRRWQ